MNTQKVAITMPKDLVIQIDEMSREEGVSRSKFISETLLEKVLNEKDHKIKKAYDRVFSDNAIMKEQIETSVWFNVAGSDEGQGW